MKARRRQCNPVILPTGKIILFGGNETANVAETAVKQPEIFDPVAKEWGELLPGHEIPRIYHSGAILLPDGRVWTVGTSYNQGNYEEGAEIYRPDYYFATRPVITDASAIGEYGGTITIQTPDWDRIDKVSLLRVTSTTHHYNTDQRLIWLQIENKTASSVTVTAPVNSRLAPAGYYMIFVLDGDGIPSEGRMIQIKSAPFNPEFYNVSSPGNFSITLQAGMDTRAGVEARLGSSLIDKELRTWTVYLKRVAAPIGNINAVVRSKTTDEVVASSTPSNFPASTLTAVYQPYTFTFDPYVIQPNDRILLEYSGNNGVRMDAWQIEKIGGTKTRIVKYKSSTGTYSGGTTMDTKDMSGIMSSE
jgi:hypothetical protein